MQPPACMLQAFLLHVGNAIEADTNSQEIQCLASCHWACEATKTIDVYWSLCWSESSPLSRPVLSYVTTSFCLGYRRGCSFVPLLFGNSSVFSPARVLWLAFHLQRAKRNANSSTSAQDFPQLAHPGNLWPGRVAQAPKSKSLALKQFSR